MDINLSAFIYGPDSIIAHCVIFINNCCVFYIQSILLWSNGSGVNTICYYCTRRAPLLDSSANGGKGFNLNTLLLSWKGKWLIGINYTDMGVIQRMRFDTSVEFIPRIVHHDDVIKWKHFPRYWPFVWGIHRLPVNSPHKGQWRGALIFSLIWPWMSGQVNNGEAGDLRHHRINNDVTVMHRSHLYYFVLWAFITRQFYPYPSVFLIWRRLIPCACEATLQNIWCFVM